MICITLYKKKAPEAESPGPCIYTKGITLNQATSYPFAKEETFQLTVLAIVSTSSSSTLDELPQTVAIMTIQT